MSQSYTAAKANAARTRHRLPTSSASTDSTASRTNTESENPRLRHEPTGASSSSQVARRADALEYDEEPDDMSQPQREMPISPEPRIDFELEAMSAEHAATIAAGPEQLQKEPDAVQEQPRLAHKYGDINMNGQCRIFAGNVFKKQEDSKHMKSHQYGSFNVANSAATVHSTPRSHQSKPATQQQSQAPNTFVGPEVWLGDMTSEEFKAAWNR